MARRLIGEFEKKNMAQGSYKSKAGDSSSIQYQKLTIIDDFGVDIMDGVQINDASSKAITETDAPEQRILSVQPENIPRIAK